MRPRSSVICGCSATPAGFAARCRCKGMKVGSYHDADHRRRSQRPPCHRPPASSSDQRACADGAGQRSRPGSRRAQIFRHQRLDDLAGRSAERRHVGRADMVACNDKAAAYLTAGRSRIAKVTPRVLATIICAAALAPAFAQEDPKTAPTELALQVTTDPATIECRRFEKLDPISSAFLSLHRTFQDDFDEHPLAGGKWVPHYAGGAAWPEARYWGGDGSDFKRKDAWNGEQQIYVDPRYAGRGTTPLGLDPFKVRDGVLSIVASRTPPELKPVLFDNEYVSGILTTQNSFSQKYGYFEIRSKLPVGMGVWPAFWMLANG